MPRILSKRKKKEKERLERAKDSDFVRCDRCGHRHLKEKMIHGLDPFASEIYPNSPDSKKDVWLCEPCHHESVWSI